MLDTGRDLETSPQAVDFDLSHHDLKISVLDQLGCKSGWLELNLLELHSFELEEHLVFSALTDDGDRLDQEACERLFSLAAQTSPLDNQQPPAKLAEQAERQIQATLSRALEENNAYFQRERDKLEQWADDQILAVEQALDDTKTKIRDTKRRARTAESLDEQKRLQQEIKGLERQQRRQRQEIFDVEDEIEAKRD